MTRPASLSWLLSDTTLSQPGGSRQRVISDANRGGFTSYVLLIDEDVGDGRLTGLLSKIVLDLTAIGSLVEPWCCGQLRRRLQRKGGTYSLMCIWSFKWAKSEVRRFLAFVQYGQYDLEKMTTLLPAMASSTVCLADIPVLGEEVARLERKAPMDLLYIPLNIAQAEKACTSVVLWLINASRDLGSAIASSPSTNDNASSDNFEDFREDRAPEAC